MLRWVTPIKNMNRTATRDVELGGRLIREGDNVLMLYPSANRDETVFEDPFTFDIARTPVTRPWRLPFIVPAPAMRQPLNRP